MRKLLPILFLLTSHTAFAFDFAGGAIQIPSGFEGPVSQDMGQAASALAFVRPHGPERNGTLLQISTWKPGKNFPDLSDEELKTAASGYLLQFLGGTARQRDNFKKGDIDYVSISGVPAAKIEWQGTHASRAVHGVMYCYIHDSTIFSLHTQDFAEYEGEFTDLAIEAFENIRIEK